MKEIKACIPPPPGVYTALITPFATKNGGVMTDRLQQNIEFQISQGVVGLVPTGTTGESSALEWHHHHQVIKHTAEAARKRAYVLAGTGSNNPIEALRASSQAVMVDGADGVLLVDCYYTRPNSLQLRDRYYKLVAMSLANDCPTASVVPYIIPKRTGTQLLPVDLAILAKACPNVRGVKEATGDLANMRQTRERLGPNFIIFSGDDNMTAAMMGDDHVKANGVISVIANIAPGPIVQMVSAFQRGDDQEGQRINIALAPLFGLVGLTVRTFRHYDGQDHEVIDTYANPCPVKTMMRLLGMDSGYLQPSLGPMADDDDIAREMSRAVIPIVRQALLKVWNNNPWVLMPIEKHYGVSISDQLCGTGKGRYTEEMFQKDTAEYQTSADSRTMKPVT